MVPIFDGIEGDAGSGVFCENDISGLGPYEGFWIGIVLGEIVANGDLQLGDAGEDAAPDALAGDLGEEALDQIQPGGRGQRCSVKRGCFASQAWTSLVLWVV